MHTVAFKRNQAPCIIWAGFVYLIFSTSSWADEPKPGEFDVVRNATEYLKSHPEDHHRQHSTRRFVPD